MHNNFILEPAESLCSFPARSVMCEGRVDPGVGCVHIAREIQARFQTSKTLD